MGYYVEGHSYSFRIKAGQDKAIMDVLRELNTHDELKRGGGGSGDETKWFSWMNGFDWSQDDVKTFLEAVGFYVEVDEAGDITDLSHDGKMGQEQLFLGVLAPFIETGSEIVWKGEDEDRWRWLFQNGKMLIEIGDIDIVYRDTRQFTLPADAF
jgi:hypothetical protein